MWYMHRWEEEKLKKYEEEFAIPGLSIERNRYLREQIETLTREVADIKARSYLIAEADPFFRHELLLAGRHVDVEVVGGVQRRRGRRRHPRAGGAG